MRRGTTPLIPPRGVLLDRQLNYSRDSPVNTATRLRAKPRYVSLLQNVQTVPRPTRLPIQRVSGFFSGVITLD